MRGKTKIIGTIGPSSSSEYAIRQLIEAGMNVARLNFSHGSHASHLETIGIIKKLRTELGKNVGILQDLSGPKIRTGDLPEEGVQLEADSTIRLTADGEYDALSPVIPICYPNLVTDIDKGSRILLDDGLLELEVTGRSADSLECRVVTGGVLLSHKGVNFPGRVISQRAPTQKDLEDLSFGIENGVDFVALSFVQTEDDIKVLRREIEIRNAHVSVIAKLETDTAIQRLDEILPECDGVMVARGDLGIETELTMLPIHQKAIIKQANRLGIYVIVATQILDSMIRNPLPTRAEVNDVANAIQDGADAVMLSGETAVGKYPVEAVRIMQQVAKNMETSLEMAWQRERRLDMYESGEMAVARSVCLSAEKLGTTLIVAHTLSGQTARLMSQCRPPTPIVALTPVEYTYYQLALCWGVETVYAPGTEDNFLDTIRKADKILVENGFAATGDDVIVSGGIPASVAGGTNIMKIHKIGEE